MKCNAIADPVMIDALYRASGAGVSTQLIVRGISCIRPGVDGLSDNISVRSILGRYLEHSRIYRFAHGGDDGGPLYLIGSADLMPRILSGELKCWCQFSTPNIASGSTRSLSLISLMMSLTGFRASTGHGHGQADQTMPSESSTVGQPIDSVPDRRFIPKLIRELFT